MFLVLAVVVVVAVVGGALYGASVFLGRPDSRQVRVTIRPGASTTGIARELADKGVVKNWALFSLYVRRRGAERRLMAGEYVLNTGLSYPGALAELLKGPRIKYYRVTIPEGLTVAQTAQAVAEQTPIKEADFLAEATRGGRDYAFLRDNPSDSLEGFLFPKTYTMTGRMKAGDAVDVLLKQFDKESGALDFNAARQRNLNLYQILIVASMVEREVKVPDERAKVAAVVYNRLDRGMLLQIDATVQYALGEQKSELTYADLAVDSPYNTYLRAGLPPGPICSPGLASIEAALKPAPVGYLYYVLTSPDGRHTFTDSAEEFERIKREQGI